MSVLADLDKRTTRGVPGGIDVPSTGRARIAVHLPDFFPVLCCQVYRGISEFSG